MKKVIFIALLLLFGLTISIEKEAFAKCEKALERLKADEADLKAANEAYDAAAKNAKQAAANLAGAVANLNAVAAGLGGQGRATSESITFGRSPTDPAFFDDPGYKAAKQAWQDAKAANLAAEGELDQAGIRRKRAQDEYDEAKAEYDRLRREHIGDEGLLRAPAPLKLDETLMEKWHKRIKQDDTDLDISFDLRKTKDKSYLDVAIISAGRGSRYKKWSPEKLNLVMGQAAIEPIETHDYYIVRPTLKAKAGVSPHLLTGVGTSYAARPTKQAQYGAACHPGEGSTKPNLLGDTFSRVGVATGVGLLTSQPKPKAKSKLKGLKGTFDITGREDRLEDMKLQAGLVNNADDNEVDIIVPVSGGRKP